MSELQRLNSEIREAVKELELKIKANGPPYREHRWEHFGVQRRLAFKSDKIQFYDGTWQNVDAMESGKLCDIVDALVKFYTFLVEDWSRALAKRKAALSALNEVIGDQRCQSGVSPVRLDESVEDEESDPVMHIANELEGA